MKDKANNNINLSGVKYLLASFVDINGSIKAKQLPISALNDVVENGAGFAGGAVWGLNLGPEAHDVLAHPDSETFRILPTNKETLFSLSNLFVDHKPLKTCPRTNLIRVIEEFKTEGYIFNCGWEPEHFLIKRNDDLSIDGWDPNKIDILQKPCYDIKSLSQSSEYLKELMDKCSEVGIEIYQCDHEDGNFQYEINWQWSHALQSSDYLTLFRYLVFEISRKYDFDVTFMAKPFSGLSGSGNHMHFHVSDLNNINLFPLNKNEQEIKVGNLGYSKLAYHFLGGLIKHKDAICALTNPTVNCYKRIQSGEAVYSTNSQYTWTPAWCSFGDNNRTQMFRSPDSNRFEDRSISGMVNPYIALSVYITAGMDGIKNKIDPGDPIIGDNIWDLPYETRRKRGLTPLPQDLSRAIDALEDNEVVMKGLGEIAEPYIKLKRSEWGDFMQYITRWETSRYSMMI